MDPLSISSFPEQAADGQRAAVPGCEPQRLDAVRRYAILDTPPEGAFDRITRLAAQIFDVPISIVSVIDHDRIWFKSAHGLSGIPEIPREPGLCSTAIEQEDAYVLADASIDPRSKDNSLVSGPFGLRFYAGVPLRTNDGYNLGTLCVIDNTPHAVDEAKVEMLTTLAKVVVDELELRLAARRLAQGEAGRGEAASLKHAIDRAATLDGATGLPNRQALEGALDDYFAESLRGRTLGGSLCVIELASVDEVNRRRGRDAGDRYLRAFASALVFQFAEDRVFRSAGTNFVVVCTHEIGAEDVRLRLIGALAAIRQNFPEAIAHCGITSFPEINGSPRVALRLAESRMFAEKISNRT